MGNKLLIVLTILISFSYSKNVKECLLLNDKDRLTCYDNIFRKDLNITNKQNKNKKANISNWVLDKEKSLMGGIKSVALSTVGTGTKEATLILRCNNNHTDVYITGNYIFFGLNGQKVKIKLGNKKPYKKWFNPSTDGQGLFYSGNVVKFIKKLQEYNTLIIEARPYNEISFQTKFNISNLSKVIQPLQKACHWK